MAKPPEFMGIQLYPTYPPLTKGRKREQGLAQATSALAFLHESHRSSEQGPRLFSDLLCRDWLHDTFVEFPGSTTYFNQPIFFYFIRADTGVRPYGFMSCSES